MSPTLQEPEAWAEAVPRILTVLALLACAGIAPAQTGEILVQSSVTAGLAHHEAKAVWEQIKPGDALVLAREPGNVHDASAVRVEWNGHVLGYLPRTENEAVARQLDRGNRLRARVVRLGQYRNHRRRLELEVYLPLQ
jgi:HIRAN domain